MNLRKIKNKRGLLLGEETIKIVIGLIVIVLLASFLFSLYYSKVKAAKQKLAFSSINGDNMIKGQIDLIASGGQPASGGISIEVPIGWDIFTFTGNEIKPNACGGENCLCICSNVLAFNIINWASERKRQAAECDKSGACLVVNNLIDRDDPKSIKIIKGGTRVFFKSEANGGISFS